MQVQAFVTRKALPTLLREAAMRQGRQLALATDETGLGRLGYRIDQGPWLTPGQAADALGVEWG